MGGRRKIEQSGEMWSWRNGEEEEEEEELRACAYCALTMMH